MLVNQITIREVKGIDARDLENIYAFLQGAVYCWVKNRKDESFAVRDLFGGENTDWSGTPLEAVYAKHKKAGKDDDAAYDASAKDAGWLLKAVLSRDIRKFEVGTSGLTNSYHWLP